MSIIIPSPLKAMPQRTDGRDTQLLSTYNNFWDKDLKKDNGVDDRNTNYTDVVNGYYDGVTELYEYGWGNSFHFSRFYKGEAFHQSLARHEHFLAAKMGLKPGMRVLDVGCGVGGPAREIAAFTDCNVIGVNNNEFQVGRATMYTKRMKLDGQVQFVKGDFMKLVEQFGENSFDAVYAIEATCHAPTWEGVYGEIMKVLKPGGVFGVYDWCMTDKWDPSIPSHKELARGIELGDGIPEMRTIEQARNAMQSVGFELEVAEDLADRQDQAPWYYPLEGDLSKAQTAWDLMTVWRIHWSGRFVTRNAMRMLEFTRVLPQGTCSVAEQLEIARHYLVEGGRSKLFTPMYMMIGRKPRN